MVSKIFDLKFMMRISSMNHPNFKLVSKLKYLIYGYAWKMSLRPWKRVPSTWSLLSTLATQAMNLSPSPITCSRLFSVFILFYVDPPSRVGGMFFTTKESRLSGMVFVHVITSSRQSGPKWMFRRICKVCKQSYSHSKLK